MAKTIHNPDLYMNDLRQVLAQGKKRLGILIGAGAPASMLIDRATGKLTALGEPLIPVVSELTRKVRESLSGPHRNVFDAVVKEIGGSPNIEMVLTRVRTLGDALGSWTVEGLDGEGYRQIADAICKEIGKAVSVMLPEGNTPYTELAGWIGGTARTHAFEIFTPNYDLLFEEAFERAHIPYFDGFCGAHEPFFDSATITNDELPPRWVRLWKLHGSLGWDENRLKEIIRRQDRNTTRLIYPAHLKYDQTRKLPYTALFERLRAFLQSPDSLLMTCGFSFSDSHIVAVIDEALSANRATTVMAFQFGNLSSEASACKVASHRANLSVYARDGAVINCVSAPWEPGNSPQASWIPIRASFWTAGTNGNLGAFLLGDFKAFSRYIALTRTEQVATELPQTTADPLVGREIRT